jgi:hypothetical protein
VQSVRATRSLDQTGRLLIQGDENFPGSSAFGALQGSFIAIVNVPTFGTFPFLLVHHQSSL